MGGEAAKERRRLKRLEAQQGADGKSSGGKSSAPAAGVDAKSPKTTDKKNKLNAAGEKNSIDDVRQRLQRKFARKANGKFKAQSVETPPAPATPTTTRSQPRQPRQPRDSHRPHNTTPHKRKSEDGNTKTWSKSSNHSNKKMTRHNEWRDKEGSVNKGKFRNQKGGKQPPAKKNIQSKQKAKTKKPKHLKRKMDHLSKTMVGGGSNDGAGTNIVDLEGQMKQLLEQMEEYKKLKQNNVAGQVKQDAVLKSKGDAEIVGKGDTDERKDGRDETTADETREEGKGVESENKERKESFDNGSSPSIENTGVKDAVKDAKPTKSVVKQPAKSSSSSSSSSSNNSSDNDSSDEEDELAEPSNARSRGKRRRGRRDANNPKEEGTAGDDTKAVANNASSEETEAKTPSGAASCQEGHKKSNAEATKANSGDEDQSPSKKKTSKKDDKRRCIGRKPVTDYTIGKTYSGTVKYIKPKLGAFIDIGSHSDAFCHISSTSEDFVSSVNDVLKVGTVLENVRVVEIDRERKRVTVSLRSGEMAENEGERLKATRQYERGLRSSRNDGYNKGSRSNGGGANHGSSPAKTYARFGDGGAESKANVESENIGENNESLGSSSALEAESTTTNNSNKNSDLKRERKIARRAERREHGVNNYSPTNNGTVEDQGWSTATAGYSPAAVQSGQKSSNSGADLKRERKLARRAERRAAMEAAAAAN